VGLVGHYARWVEVQIELAAQVAYFVLWVLLAVYQALRQEFLVGVGWVLR
jgi:hypothetical protein